MKTFFHRAPDQLDPGYRLDACVKNGNLQVQSVVSGARDPRPHLLLNVSLPAESLEALAGIIKGE